MRKRQAGSIVELLRMADKPHFTRITSLVVLAGYFAALFLIHYHLSRSFLDQGLIVPALRWRYSSHNEYSRKRETRSNRR